MWTRQDQSQVDNAATALTYIVNQAICIEMKEAHLLKTIHDNPRFYMHLFDSLNKRVLDEILRFYYKYHYEVKSFSHRESKAFIPSSTNFLLTFLKNMWFARDCSDDFVKCVVVTTLMEFMDWKTVENESERFLFEHGCFLPSS